MGEVAIVTCPQCDEMRPRLFFNGLKTHPALLLIARKVERTLQCGSHKTLMIVRGRINQMSYNLLRRPPASQGRFPALLFADLLKNGFG